MAGKIKGLQQWCQRMTAGYRDVHMKDFTTSWRDGLAFCAMIHRFRPDLIDYDSLSKENVYDNNHLAFTVAEQELDIPAFLEAADMVALRTPDKLSVITYVSQYYNKLGTLPQLGGPGVQGKKSTAAAPAAHGTKRHQPAEPLSEPEPKKQLPAKKPQAGDSTAKVKTLGDRCGICSNKVYLLERHVEDGKLYHRSCFRHSDLSPTNKVYTRSPFFSPSLHGKDGGPTSPKGDKASPAISRKLHGGDDKHGPKRPAEEAGGDKGKKSEVRKFLFSKDGDSKNKGEDKAAGRDWGLGKKDHFKDKQSQPDHSGVASKLDLHSNSRAASTPHSDTHSSMDFLSGGKSADDAKSSKRHLPLIFQAAGSADDGAPQQTKNGAGSKTSLFSRNKDSAPKSCDLSAKQTSDSVHTVTAGKRLNDKSGHSVLSGSGGGGGLTGKSSQPEKSASESKVTEKSSGPMAKPRSSKVLPGASKQDQEEEKSSAFPKARPRSAVPSADTSKKSAPEKAKSPLALRKAPTRPKSPPSRDLSPPPLPASAPPPLPHTPPVASVPPPSSLHVLQASSPQPSPRNSRSAASKLNSHSGDNALSKSSTSSSSTESKGKSGFSLFGKKRAGGGSPRHEEPMDVEMAFREARAQHGEEPVAVLVVPSNTEQEDKTALSGLLKSLAQVRNTGPSSNTPTSSATATSHTTPHHANSESKASVTSHSSAGSGLASSKITLGHISDGNHKPSEVSKEKEKDKKSAESTKKSILSFNFLNSGNTSNKGADTQKKTSKSSEASSDKKTLPVSKLGETVTITLNTAKTDDSASTPISISSKQTDKSSDRVPLYKKKADSNLANRTNRLGDSPRGTPGKDVSSGSGGAFGAKKDRPKSAADLFGGKELSTPKQSSTNTDNSPAPAFAQVKLRDSSQTAGERKERPKSAGILLDSGTDSRPSWQQEAKRKMAVFRGGGFVDPETKKVVGKNTETEKTQDVKVSPREDVVGIGKQDKNKNKELPARPAPFHNAISESRQKEDKPSLAKSPGNEQPSPSVSAANLKKKEEKTLIGGLKGILKGKSKDTSETTKNALPTKPERVFRNEAKEQPETKTSLSTAKTVKSSDASVSSSTGEVSTTKKKISVSNLEDNVDQTITSSPPSELLAGRKKISVDINFDFDLSSSMEASDRLSPLRTTEKATPPARPPPPQRTSMSPGRLSAIELQKQLLDIDSKLSELELRGRTLEDSIRSEDTFQCSDEAVPQASTAAEEEDENLMIEWFQLVTDKNELVRKECDLVYMSREQDLEDEQSQIESQLHYLLCRDGNDKSFEEQEEEEYLIQRKVEIVNQRNSIVDCIDEDRLRYVEEDRDIAQMLQEKGFMKDGSSPEVKEKSRGAKSARKQVGSSMFYA